MHAEPSVQVVKVARAESASVTADSLIVTGHVTTCKQTPIIVVNAITNVVVVRFVVAVHVV